MSASPTVSIVLGTLQRLPHLKRALASARRAVGKLSHEFVIVDGGSTDGTLQWLRTFARDPHTKGNTTVIEQGKRLGAVKAFNAGFAVARGEFVAAFNDDAEYIGTPVADAVRALRDDNSKGQIAIPYGMPDELPHLEFVNIPSLGRILYANFAVIRRELGDELGWWGDYFQYGGDTELSVKVWMKGLRVVPLCTYPPEQILTKKDARVIHYFVDDDTRVPNVEQRAFGNRWNTPARAHAVIPQYDRGGRPPDIPQNAPEMPRLLKNAVLLRFLGIESGRHPYTAPGSNFKYQVSARENLVWVDGKDVAFLLGLRQGRGALFERV